MKNNILDKCMKIIKENKDYNDTKLEEIRYGLEGIYLLINKLIIIILISIILNIFKEMIIFLLIFNIIRLTAFGLHATKSWICLISSTLAFIGIPLLIINVHLNTNLKLIIGIISTIHIFIFSPSDTHKRPIINKKRRRIYKLLSTTISIIYIILSINIKNNYISNCLIFSTLLENILISPLTYKLFKLPYNNYKNYKLGLN